MNDKTLKVIYNLEGDFKNLKPAEKDLLEYMANGKSSNNFTDKIDGIVAELKKQEKWRREYMTWEMTMLQVQETARNEAIHEAQVEAAINLFANGVPVETIAKSLHMSEEQVEEIIKGNTAEA